MLQIIPNYNQKDTIKRILKVTTKNKKKSYKINFFKDSNDKPVRVHHISVFYKV